jgi:hypothetical protein
LLKEKEGQGNSVHSNEDEGDADNADEIELEEVNNND